MFMFNGEYMMGMEKIRSMLLNWSIGHNFKDKYGNKGKISKLYIPVRKK